MTLGFYHNQERCIGCGACQVACKDKFDIQAAGPRTRRVDTYESGDFPNCGIFTTSIGCNHCDLSCMRSRLPYGGQCISAMKTVWYCMTTIGA